MRRCMCGDDYCPANFHPLGNPNWRKCDRCGEEVSSDCLKDGLCEICLMAVEKSKGGER
jgi:hypothetical protein